MKLGLMTMNTWDGIFPAELGAIVESAGYESLWLGEHSHIPVASPLYPAGGELPDAYRNMLDPYLALTAAATATTTLMLGTAIALVLERPVLVTAKEVATLDFLSGGRVLFGVGVGWNDAEFANLSTIPWTKRYRGVREAVAALREIWTQETPEYHGEFVDFAPVWSYPKPVQKPYPPVLMSGLGKLALQHVAEWADGWFPMDNEYFQPRDFMRRGHKAFRAADRDPATVPTTILMVGGDERRVLEYAGAGADRVVIAMPPMDTSRTAVLSAIERYAPLIDKVCGGSSPAE